MIRDLLSKHNCLTISEFKTKFRTQKTPDIVSNSIDLDALNKWDVQYFKDKYPDKNVVVDFYSALEKQEWGKLQLMLPDALNLICNNTDQTKKHYLMQKSIVEEFPELLADISLPIYVNQNVKHVTNLWIGESGIISQPHYDCSDNFLTQILGRKRVRLFSPSDSKNMYPHAIDDDMLGDISAAHISRIDDTDLVNFDHFPKFKQANCFEGIIYPGDILFIPAGWWHEVKSLDMSISVNFWQKMKLFDLSDSQATDWICSVFFYFASNNFHETVNKYFDFSDFGNDVEIAKVSMSKNLRCIAAVFLLNFLNKIRDVHDGHESIANQEEISEWISYLALAKLADNDSLDEARLLEIIHKLKVPELI